MERDFKGIWIPKEVWLSKELTIMEKLFFVEINSLDNEKGCFAGNGYFAEFFELSKTRVSVIINSLVSKGYITSTLIYKEGTKQILKRVLKICYIGYITKQGEGYITKQGEPIKEKFIDNNTVNNTIVNNTINKKAKAYFDDLDLNNLFIEFLDLRK
ncbi:MAG: helix-turn-helix domain-containing protein, partial [Emcibacteraceae bacterium]|nr:helix-turn-helix domain-containing protein [Emcibacteraceae bacterium]